MESMLQNSDDPGWSRPSPSPQGEGKMMMSDANLRNLAVQSDYNENFILHSSFRIKNFIKNKSLSYF